MKHPKVLHNPFLLTWIYSHEDWEKMPEWLEEHMTEDFQFISLGRNSVFAFKGEQDKLTALKVYDPAFVYPNDLQPEDFLTLVLFESPRDAMLFKLTWVNNG